MPCVFSGEAFGVPSDLAPWRPGFDGPFWVDAGTALDVGRLRFAGGRGIVVDRGAVCYPQVVFSCFCFAGEGDVDLELLRLWRSLCFQLRKSMSLQRPESQNKVIR